MPKVRHILGLSGGKDSAALAIYMRERVPDMEYVFCDTGKELPETYEYLDRLEAFLGRKIVRLGDDGRSFDHFLALRQLKRRGMERGFLPSPRMRWCTELLKIKPLERYIGEDQVISYVGLRADENRLGHMSTKPNIVPCFPFKEDGIILRDVLRILDSSGLGRPQYYKWRSRSGCFFCFFQRKIEWVGLLENHPELFEQAKKYERPRFGRGRGYTWCDNESLEDLCRPERVAQIKAEHRLQLQREITSDRRLWDTIGDDRMTRDRIEEIVKSWLD